MLSIASATAQPTTTTNDKKKKHSEVKSDEKNKMKMLTKNENS